MRPCLGLLFRYIGSPARFRGSGKDVSASFVLTRTLGSEPMKIHCIPGYISALYLVEYPEREEILLLDSGFPSDLERVRFYIEEVLSDGKSAPKRMVERLRLVVATHSHIDHAGASKGYEQCGIPVAYARGMEESYHNPRGHTKQLVETCLTQFMAGRLGRDKYENPFVFSNGLLGPYWQMPTGPLRLDDGTPLPSGFNDWVGIKCPGHTSHMICLYHPYTQIFYAADMFVGIRKGFFPPVPIDSPRAYNYSLHRLRGLPTRCVLLAHGGIIDVNDRCGSWDAFLDDVVHNGRSSATECSRFTAVSCLKRMRSVFTDHKASPQDIFPLGSLPLPKEVAELPPLHIIDS
ncbi:metallo-beta-lactamase superfamily [Trypanosoma grayi]|uniref:metallo-beta-lactamase superfamily n=1 Tax=Trypanosoma grayi TaxID=71804 RepID=UPI0004F40DCF|nr:metallo-beta-lactamase superfamily [Trypanosoma grayi]KEG13037.1 metallo-beta-lactamase superfamily [Trypanosoma grayi]